MSSEPSAARLIQNRESRSASRWILAATILASGVVFLDGTVVTVALARIGHDLRSPLFGTLEAQTYVYNGYLLAMSALLIPAGAAGDRYGRKRVFLAGLIGFGVASLLCGLAPSMETLILARLLQGMAAAFLVPGSLALLRLHFQGEEQGRAYGLWAAGTSLTTLAGPFLGGVLVDLVSWRAIFLINLPLVLIAVFAGQRHVVESRDENSAHLDWTGAALFAVATGGLSFGVIYGQEHQWQAVEGWLALALGALSLAALPLWLSKTAHPLVSLTLFKVRSFTVINLATLVIYASLYISGYYLLLFLQGVAGYSAAAAGLSGLPVSLFLIFLSPRIGRLAGRFGPRPFLVAGPLLMAAGTAWLARIPQHTSAWRLDLAQPASLIPPLAYATDVLPEVLAFGLGISLLVAPLTSALMNSVPEANVGLASAFNNAISRIGPQLAGAAVFVAVTALFFARLGARPPGVSPLNRPLDGNWLAPALAASTDAFHLAMLFCSGLLVAGALISLTLAGRSAKPPDPAAG
ncbi:MAG: MFS transporter [Candidatus Dormibacter sp.]|uniref:MFS transporter n=1 Tax=Candidatus Dormibacter sp. TaxID=2973982 RepID=UPI000DB3EBA8|nr:MAG: MFS transporter [Candidatus Dormibacteraeota bacterium]